MDIFDLITHLDSYLGAIIQQYGALTYLILFLVIFCETGLVFLPFLPGDSLLFVAGMFASMRMLDVWSLFAILSVAAIAGDTLNYWLGRRFGERIFLRKHLLKREHFDKAEAFFKKHGRKTIILARFIPVVRTVAPFVAGTGKMHYSRFLASNVAGGLIWTVSFLSAGYFFGAIPVVRENLFLLIIAIIAVSLLPAAAGLAKHKLEKKKTQAHNN